MKLSKGVRRRLWVYGSLVGAFALLYWYQPMRFDVIERRPKNPLPLIDPDSTRFFAPGTRVLVITAHPDDSEFYIGGTLHQLSKTADITQMILTDGDKAYYGPFANSTELRKVRRAEAVAAMKAWNGRSVTFLGELDGRLFVTDRVVEAIVEKIREVKPEFVLAFDGDYPPRVSHRDHRNAGLAAEAAVKQAGLPLWLLRFSTNADNFVVDVTDDWDAKRELLAIHDSQFGKKLDGIMNLVASFAEADGARIDVALGEGFRATRFDP